LESKIVYQDFFPTLVEDFQAQYTNTKKQKRDDPRKKWKKRKEVKNRLKVEKK
jgi:hypothetical protein